jgi:hypothetical protein
MLHSGARCPLWYVFPVSLWFRPPTDDNEQTKVLKALVEKGSTISRLQLEAALQETRENDSRRPPGGAESLYHLMIRLDFGEWWADGPRRR